MHLAFARRAPLKLQNRPGGRPPHEVGRYREWGMVLSLVLLAGCHAPVEERRVRVWGTGLKLGEEQAVEVSLPSPEADALGVDPAVTPIMVGDNVQVVGGPRRLFEVTGSSPLLRRKLNAELGARWRRMVASGEPMALGATKKLAPNSPGYRRLLTLVAPPNAGARGPFMILFQGRTACPIWVQEKDAERVANLFGVTTKDEY